MQKEKIELLVLDIDTPKEMNIESIVDNYDGLTIQLVGVDVKTAIEVKFDFTYSYRNINESFLLKVWDEFEKEKLGNTFYKIKNSSYLEHFHSLSYDIYRDFNVQHFAIYTMEDCLDILSAEKPKIKIL